MFTNGEGKEPVDVSAARMKCIGGYWLEEVVEYLQDNPLIIVKRFKQAGIYEALGILGDDVDLSEDEAENEAPDEDGFQEDSSDEQESSKKHDYQHQVDEYELLHNTRRHMPLIVF